MTSKKKSKTQKLKKRGRPSSFCWKVADEICRRLASGESLIKICADEGMPSTVTVFKWERDNEDFLNNYARAREAQGERNAHEINEIADQEPLYYYDESGNKKIDSAWVQLQKTRIDARKWNAVKLLPKKYGDAITHKGDAENPLNPVVNVILTKSD